MATFYKYAERSAESQVNWAEIGKNMTDMLRQEVDLREQKKAAIDEATRKLAQEVADAPQGESESAKAEAIRYADQVSRYMLQQERLLKSGLLDPKDYMVARQNLTDGTRQAFGAMKRFQEEYGKLMDGVRSGETSIIQVKRLEKIQGYGNFRQSGFFIDSPTGKVNVGLKEEQIIDGKKVMGLKKGSTVGMQYIDGGIYGDFKKYDYRKDIMDLSKSLGKEIRLAIDPATMTKIGTAKSLSDLRQRIVKIATEDPTQEKELFNFYDAMYKALDGYLVNDNSLGSLLADTLGYDWTDNPEEAKKNPDTVLEGIDPNTGQAKLEFTDKNRQDALDFMMQQFLGTINVEEDVKALGQVSRPRANTDAENEQNRIKADSKNIAENLVFALTGDANKASSGTKFLSGLTGIDFNKTKDGFSIIDEDGNLQEFKFKADGKLADPTAFVKSFVGPLSRAYKIDQDAVIREFKNFLPKGATLNETTEATGFEAGAPDEETAFDKLNTMVSRDIDLGRTAIVGLVDENEIADKLNEQVGPNLGIEFGVPYTTANSIYVTVNGKDSPNYDVGKGLNDAALKKIRKFIIENLAPGASLEERNMAAENVLAGFGELD
jgi:hypothetical protein